MIKLKKPTYKELAKELGITESAIQKWQKERRIFMILGLWKKRELEQEKRSY